MMALMLVSGCKKDPVDLENEYEVRFAINAMSVEKPETKSSSGIFDLKSAFASPNEVTHVRIGIDGSYEVPTQEFILPYNVEDGITQAIKLSRGGHDLTSISLLKYVSEDVYEVLYSAVSIN